MLLVLLAHQEAVAGGPDPFLVAGGVLLGALGLVWLARSSARSIAAAVLAGVGCTLVAVAVLGHRHQGASATPTVPIGQLACSVEASETTPSAALLVPPPTGFVATINEVVPPERTLSGCRAHEVEVAGRATAVVAVGRVEPGALDVEVDLRPPGSTPVQAGGVEARVLEGFEQGAAPVAQWAVDDLVVMAELDADGAGALDEPRALVEALVGGVQVADAGGEPRLSLAPGADLRLGAEVPPTTWAINGAPRHLVRYADAGDDGAPVAADALEGAPALSVETIHLPDAPGLLDRALAAARRAADEADPVTVGAAEGSLIVTDVGTAVVAAGSPRDLVVVRGSSVADDQIVDAAADVSLVAASEAEDAAPVADLAGPIEREADGTYVSAPATPVFLPALLFAAPVVLFVVGLALWRWRRRARSLG